jgi:sigma-B regulation protein RsbU (phosphoserine phosphatase)
MEIPLTSVEHKIETLRNCVFLGDSPDSVLLALASNAETLRVAGGETVITKGDAGSTMYFIISGKVRVHDGEVIMAYLGEGEIFGEMAVLDQDVRSASVTTESDVILLSLERNVLFDAISTNPESFQSILRAVLQRERRIVEDVKTRTEQLLAYEKELEIGRRIQADFLPETVPEIENWEIASYFEAAREVAGDFFDVFKLKTGNYVGIVIGDVCDKGVGAALFMTLFRSLIRASSLYGFMQEAPGELDSESDSARASQLLENSIMTTNRYIATTHRKSSMFASVFFGLFDPQNGELIYINAGHEAPIIFRQDGSQELLDITGGVVGLFPGANFNVATAQMNEGDLLFTYTDGVNEAKNEKGEQFTERRILEYAAPEGNSPEKFLGLMLDHVKEFRGTAAQSDDITMLAIKYLAAE